MADYKWRMFYDARDRLCFQAEGTDGYVVVLPNGQYLIAFGKVHEVVTCSRDEALLMAANMLDQKSK